MKEINPYRSPESQDSATTSELIADEKPRFRIWPTAALAAFILILFLPTGTVFMRTDGSPPKYMYFWWAYAPNVFIDFKLRLTERVVTAIAHVLISLLLGFVIQFVASLFRSKRSDLSKAE